MTPIDRLRAWWAGRDYVERPCGRDLLTFEPSQCPNTYTPREARRAGHDGYCSHECAAYRRENAIL